MVKCSKCASDVPNERKSWQRTGRPNRKGKIMQLEIGLFDCPKCKNVFRVVLSKIVRQGEIRGGGRLILPSPGER